MGAICKNVLEHVGGILVSNPNVIFENIHVLNRYGISLTNDSNNNGYVILGMQSLPLRLDYLIEKGLWKKSDGITLDNIDFIRGLNIQKTYGEAKTCKDKPLYGKIDSASSDEEVLINKMFVNENFDEVRLENLFNDHNVIKDIVLELDNKYLNKEGTYSFGVHVVSRERVLCNLCNYRGKEKDLDMFVSCLKYRNNVANIDEVINAVMPLLEMGEESVKLSQRI